MSNQEVFEEFKLRTINSAAEFAFNRQYRNWKLDRFMRMEDQSVVMLIMPMVEVDGHYPPFSLPDEYGSVRISKRALDWAFLNGAPAIMRLVTSAVRGAIKWSRHECLN